MGCGAQPPGRQIEPVGARLVSCVVGMHKQKSSITNRTTHPLYLTTYLSWEYTAVDRITRDIGIDADVDTNVGVCYCSCHPGSPSRSPSRSRI